MKPYHRFGGGGETAFRIATYMRNGNRSRGLTLSGSPKARMTMKTLMRALLIGSGLVLAACNPLDNQPVGNSNVPQPAKPVELKRYLGNWYEQARYEAGFQKGCEAVTAEYAQKSDGAVVVVNSCHQGGVTGPSKTAEATARVVDGSNGSKLKVTFFWPIQADYWVLDRAPDYSWSIVGEPSGRYLWILTRKQSVSPRQYAALVERAKALGYDVNMLRRTQQ